MPAAEKKPEKKTPANRAFKAKFELLQKVENETGVARDPRLCIARRNGVFCKRWAIAGGTVCPTHGGASPQAKVAAKARLESLLLRKVERLDEISEQNTHMPSALGATQAIINRVMGKVGDAPKRENTGPTIQIGISLAGGGPQTPPAIQVRQIPAAMDVSVIDADPIDE